MFVYFSRHISVPLCLPYDARYPRPVRCLAGACVSVSNRPVRAQRRARARGRGLRLPGNGARDHAGEVLRSMVTVSPRSGHPVSGFDLYRMPLQVPWIFSLIPLQNIWILKLHTIKYSAYHLATRILRLIFETKHPC